MTTEITTPETAGAPMSLFNIRTWADARAFIHTAAPVVTILLTTYGVTDHQQAALWLALVAALVSPALSVINTADGARRWIHGVLGAALAVVIAYGALNPDTIELWLPVVALVIGGAGGGLASANTNTSASTERASVHQRTE